MTQEAAGRIQSHADKTGRNQDFKARAQSAAQTRMRNHSDFISKSLGSGMSQSYGGPFRLPLIGWKTVAIRFFFRMNFHNEPIM